MHHHHVFYIHQILFVLHKYPNKNLSHNTILIRNIAFKPQHHQITDEGEDSLKYESFHYNAVFNPSKPHFTLLLQQGVRTDIKMYYTEPKPRGDDN